MDDAVEKDAIRCTQTVQISELLEEIVQLKMDVDILRSDFIAKKKIMMDERDSLELVIDELKRKEIKRNQDEKVAIELALTKSIKAAAIEPVKIVQSETFSDFLKKNEIEKMLEEQIIQKRNNEYLLEQQKLVLGETIRLLSSSADEVNKRKKERERERLKELEDEKEKVKEKEMKTVSQVEVDINTTKGFREQIRYAESIYSSFITFYTKVKRCGVLSYVSR